MGISCYIQATGVQQYTGLQEAALNLPAGGCLPASVGEHAHMLLSLQPDAQHSMRVQQQVSFHGFSWVLPGSQLALQLLTATGCLLMSSMLRHMLRRPIPYAVCICLHLPGFGWGCIIWRCQRADGVVCNGVTDYAPGV